MSMLEATNLTEILFLDIETVPQQSKFEDLPDKLKLLWEKKSSYARKHEETPEEFYERAGIWAEFGKIVCISVGKFRDDNELRIKSFHGHDESEILNNFAAMLHSLPKEITLCAHNGKEFDFPYLCRRMLINGIKIPYQLNVTKKRPWEVNLLDTLELWKFGDYKNYTSLELLAAIFDIPTPKEDIDGSQVAHVYYVEQNLEKIATYCQKDVITIAKLLQKFKGMETISDEYIVFVS